MSNAEAVRIFKNIYSDEYDEMEKDEALKIVANMETHNAITKEELVTGLNYVLDILGK